jgi:2-succinyl-6-hydroxy-2,4-cyclohexadiene-1-carboxylate synthase
VQKCAICSDELMPSVNVLDVQHAYELSPTVESKPTLVFVHGWLLSRRYWTPMVEKLAPSYQCLTYDLRGFGESHLGTSDRVPDVETEAAWSSIAITQPSLHHEPTRYAPAAYAQDLVALLKGLNITRAWVVGHSLGGSIALWAAVLSPQIIEGVVCLNAGGGIYIKEAFERFRAAGRQMLGFRPAWLPLVPLVDLAFSRMMVHRPLPLHWGRQRVVDFVAAHPEAALQSLLDSTVPEQVHLLPQVVAQLRQPVYFLGGQQDNVMELKYVYHLASFHQSFRDGETNVIEIPDCGHMGMLERTDALSRTLQQLQEKVPQPHYPPPALHLL